MSHLLSFSLSTHRLGRGADSEDSSGAARTALNRWMSSASHIANLECPLQQLESTFKKEEEGIRVCKQERVYRQRRVQPGLGEVLKVCKDTYRRKLETKLRQKNVRGVLAGMGPITGYEVRSTRLSGSLEGANELKWLSFLALTHFLPHACRSPVTLTVINDTHPLR